MIKIAESARRHGAKCVANGVKPAQVEKAQDENQDDIQIQSEMIKQEYYENCSLEKVGEELRAIIEGIQ